MSFGPLGCGSGDALFLRCRRRALTAANTGCGRLAPPLTVCFCRTAQRLLVPLRFSLLHRLRRKADHPALVQKGVVLVEQWDMIILRAHWLARSGVGFQDAKKARKDCTVPLRE